MLKSLNLICTFLLLLKTCIPLLNVLLPKWFSQPVLASIARILLITCTKQFGLWIGAINPLLIQKRSNWEQFPNFPAYQLKITTWIIKAKLTLINTHNRKKMYWNKNGRKQKTLLGYSLRVHLANQGITLEEW
jgi:hypothetical protein